MCITASKFSRFRQEIERESMYARAEHVVQQAMQQAATITCSHETMWHIFFSAEAAIFKVIKNLYVYNYRSQITVQVRGNFTSK